MSRSGAMTLSWRTRVGIAALVLGACSGQGTLPASSAPRVARAGNRDRFYLVVQEGHAWQVGWPSGACREVERPRAGDSMEVRQAPGGRPYALVGPPSSDSGPVYLYRLGRHPVMRLIGEAAFGPSWLDGEQLACPTLERGRLAISVFDLDGRKRSTVDLGLSKYAVEREEVIIGPWLPAERCFLAGRGRRLFTVNRSGRWHLVARLPEPSFHGITALVTDETGKRIAVEVHRTGGYTDVWVSTRGTTGLLPAAPLDLVTKREADSPVWPSVGAFSPAPGWLTIGGTRNAVTGAGYLYRFASRKLLLVGDGEFPRPWLGPRELLLDVEGAPPRLKIASLGADGKISVRTVRVPG